MPFCGRLSFFSVCICYFDSRDSFRRVRRTCRAQIGFTDQLLREMNHAGEEAPVEARVPRQPGPVAGSNVQVHMHLVPIMKHRRCLVWPFPDLLVRPS